MELNLNNSQICDFIAKFKKELIKKSGLRIGEIEQLSKREFNELINTIYKDVIIDKDNIHLYYEFMRDEELEKYFYFLITGDNELRKRFITIGEVLNIDKNSYGKYLYSHIFGLLRCENGFRELKTDYGTYILKFYFFGIKDTLKPIDDYIEEIKQSEAYKSYLANKAAK